MRDSYLILDEYVSGVIFSPQFSSHYCTKDFLNKYLIMLSLESKGFFCILDYTIITESEVIISVAKGLWIGI